MRAEKKVIVFVIIFLLVPCYGIPISVADVSANETPETIDTAFQPFDDDISSSGTNSMIQPTSSASTIFEPTTKPTTKPTTIPTTTPITELPTRSTKEPETLPPVITIDPLRTQFDPSTASFQDLYSSSLTSKWTILSFISILALAGIAYYYYRKE